jgi:hypothetical protein
MFSILNIINNLATQHKKMAGKQVTKQGSQEIPHIQCAEDISLLSLRQLSALAKSWVVDVSGLGQKKDIEEKLIKFWMSHRKKEKSDIVSQSCFTKSL